MIFSMLEYVLHDIGARRVVRSNVREERGRALLSYLNQPLKWRADDPRLSGHSNKWESREIAVTLNSLGYGVDAIFYANKSFLPRRKYDVLMDIHGNMQRLAPLLPDSLKLFHITGSYPRFQNAAEARRAKEFEERTSRPYRPKRWIEDPDEFDRSLEAADRCSLIGNETTLSTFPERFRKKITPVRVSASRSYIKPASKLAEGEEFVWFFGTGAVHKGLDRTLEAFSRLPGLKLNVIGRVDRDEEFMAAYQEALRRPNIRYHGHLDPESDAFREIVERSIAFVAPSCSEGISPAAATMMQAGLYPIVSRETGLTLPDGRGIYLSDCSPEEIAQACSRVADMPAPERDESIAECQRFALGEYSREAFSEDMRAYLGSALGAKEGM